MLAAQSHAQVIGGGKCARVAPQRASVVVGRLGNFAGSVGDEPAVIRNAGSIGSEWQCLGL